LERGYGGLGRGTRAAPAGQVAAEAVNSLSTDNRKKGTNTAATVAPAKTKEPAGQDRTLAELEAELKRLEAKAPDRPKAMAVAEGEKVGDVWVCIRGNVHNKGDIVPRGFLQAATPPAKGKTAHLVRKKADSGRRELADWIASPDNPLTARVMVNRIWHHLFGAGLVRTMDNFGRTGELPSHPELLDY